MTGSLVQRPVSRLKILALCLGTAGMVACGVSEGGNHLHPAVVVAPAQAQIRAGDTQQFKATVTGITPTGSASSTPPSQPNPPSTPITISQSRARMGHAGLSSPGPNIVVESGDEVTWSVNGVAGGNATVGTINSNGLYAAPAVLPSNTAITVTATSVANLSASGEAAVALENAIPVVQSAQPSSVTVGNFTLSVAGSKFAKGAEVLLNGTALQTTFVSATQLTATGTATQPEVGKATITVENPNPGAIVSATAYALQIDPALKVTVNVSPATAQVREGGTQQFSVTVTGSTNPAVSWSVNGVTGGNSSLGTVDASGLYKAPASLPNPNSVTVTATSVAASGSSATAMVALQNPIPLVTAVSPNPVTVGNFTLTVTGTNFVSGATVSFGGQFLDTTYVSSTKLTATGTASTQQVGSVAVEVQNPDPGSVESSALNLQVSSASPVVSAAVAARFLEQSTFGPTPQLIAHVQQIGLQAFLNEQFTAPASTYPALVSTDSMSVMQQRFFANAVNGQDQLRQRVALALSEQFVISAIKISDPTAFVLWMNMLQKDAFGNHSTLLNDVTLSPAMGNYLDMGNNDGCSGCRPNENYGREVLQLFTIGLAQLNPDGSPQVDGSGNPIPTYQQATVDGFSDVFTGWTYPAAPGTTAQFYDPLFYSGPMIPFASHHNTTAKTLLDTTLPAGNNIQTDLNAALKDIFNHPNVGPFLAQHLIQNLVTSNPSPAYVARVSAVFNDNGSGVRGDLKAVVSAILLDPEARRGDDLTQVQASDGHLKEPLLYITNVLRAANATTDGGSNLQYYASNMGQYPFYSPSVFNFYPPNNVIPGTTLLGPEFKLMNTSTAIARINYVNDLVYGNVGATTTVNLSPYVTVAGDVNKLLTTLSGVMLHSQMSSDMQGTLASTLSGITDLKQRTQAAFFLIASSSQYQVEH